MASEHAVLVVKGKEVLIDGDDLERFGHFPWRFNAYGYVCRGETRGRKYRLLYLHRLILNAGKGTIVDHRNGDICDLRKDNLRRASPAQSVWNTKSRGGTSRYKGVFLNKHGRWVASITINGKTTYLGSYHVEEVAARAYDEAARQMQGEFACLNLPSDIEREQLRRAA